MSPAWSRLLLICVALFGLTLTVTAPTRGQKETDEEDADPEPSTALTNSVRMKLKRIRGGKFTMGSPKEEVGHEPREGPQHEVEISSFYLGVYEVTQKQYEKVMDKNPSGHAKNGNVAAKVQGMDTGDFPVENVSWEDATDFCSKLSALPAEKKAGRKYRLPTEAEWEYACRAGTTTRFFQGDKIDAKDANVSETELGRTCKVGSYKPNKWGLYDLHGNVCEWCSDWHDEGYYKVSPKRDPKGPNAGTSRVMRGGCLVYSADGCRSARRDQGGKDHRIYTVGFRVACNVGR